MGAGDALIAAGVAQRLFNLDPLRRPITILNDEGKPRWHPVWLGNPAIRIPTPNMVVEDYPSITCGVRSLPYLNYPCNFSTNMRFSPTWRVACHRPTMYLTAAQRVEAARLRATYGPYMVVEPTADRKSITRRPSADFWQALIDHPLRREIPLRPLQLIHADAAKYDHLVHLANSDFIHACVVLAGADLLVVTEGGLAHAAAALNIPAVVLWGGAISSFNLSYPDHCNIVDDSPQTPCGQLVPCDHCAAAWQRLTPDAVWAAAGAYWRTITREVHA